MAFPGGSNPRVDLMLRTDSMLAPQWVDVTSDVFNTGESSVTIQRGRTNEATNLTPSWCRLAFKNNTGKYAPRNPSSPYYGLLGRNTPLRVGVGQPPIGNARWTTTDSTSLVAPSVTAAGAGLAVAFWAATPVGNITTPVGWTAQSETDAAESTYRSASKTVTAGAVGNATATFSTTATEQAALMVWLPGSSVTIQSTITSFSGTGADLSGNFISGWAAGDTLLAITSWQFDPAGRMGPPSMASAEADPWVLVADSGARDGLRVQAWTCQPAKDPGAALRLFASNDLYGDVSMRVMVLRGVDSYRCRFVGEIAEWPVAWDPHGARVESAVTASGVSRRLGAGGTAQLLSTVRRSLQSAAQLVAYWPVEDAVGSTSIASAIQGGAPLSLVGTPKLANYAGFPGAYGIATWNGSGALGSVPDYTNTGELMFGALVYVPAAVTNGANIVSVYMLPGTGTIRDVVLEYRTGGGLAIKITNQSGTNIVDQSSAFAIDARMFYATVSVTQNGANVDWVMRVHYIVAGTDTATSLQFSGSGAGLTLGVVNNIRVALESGNNNAQINQDVAIGHVVVCNQDDMFSAIRKRALVGHFNEKAEDRVARVCREDAVPVYVQHNAEAKRHGIDMPGALLGVVAESEKLDLGQLYEPRGHLGLAYRTRDSWQSLDPSLTLSYSAGNVSAPFVPVDDDQRTLNDVTATRTGGSSARYVVTSGPLSVLPPPDGVGTYEAEITLNAAYDSELPDHASWRAHVGTWDAARWPEIGVDLFKNPSLVAAVGALDVGDVVRLTNLPSWVPPGPTDLLVIGYVETICRKPGRWTFRLQLLPYGPYKVLSLLDGYNRLASETTTLAEDLDTTETGVDVAVVAGSALWTTVAGNLPFDIFVGGERMTVTAVSGASSPQTFTVTRSVNGVVKTHLTGATVALADPVFAAL